MSFAFRMFFLIVFMFPPAIALADQCKDVLKGIFDYSMQSSSQTFEKSFMNWFCQNEFLSKESARRQSAGMKIALPVDGIPVEFGGSYSSEKYGKTYWNKALCSYISGNNNYKRKFFSELRSSNPDVVKAWQNCIRIRQAKPSGLYCSSSQTSNSGEVRVQVIFVPGDDEINKAIVDEVKATSSLNVADLKAIEKATVRLTPSEFVIRRVNGKRGLAAGSISVRATSATGKKSYSCIVGVPEIYRAEFCWSPTCEQWDASANKCMRCRWKVSAGPKQPDENFDLGVCSCLPKAAKVNVSVSLGMSVIGHDRWVKPASCTARISVGKKSTAQTEICNNKHGHQNAGYGSQSFNLNQVSAGDEGVAKVYGRVLACEGSKGGKSSCDLEGSVEVVVQ